MIEYGQSGPWTRSRKVGQPIQSVCAGHAEGDGLWLQRVCQVVREMSVQCGGTT